MDNLPVSFDKIRVLVVGDIMLDRYIWGKVNRISPEAPVPVVKMQRITETLGGAGNVANNLSGLGCAVTVVGVCGADQTAASLRRILGEKGVSHQLIVDETRPTTTKTRIMAHTQQVLRLDEEDAHALSPAMENQLLSVAVQEMAHCQAVILSDYGKGLFASDAITRQIVLGARKQGLPVLVDPKGTDWQRYQQATCITPNTNELEAVTGSVLDEDEDKLISSAQGVRTRFGVEWLLVTRGPKGMCLVGPGDALLIPAQAREVFDVSGAGDTVIATLAASLATGDSMQNAAHIANLAAGIVVGKLGTQPILASELATLRRFNDQQRYYPFSAAKMTALDAAQARVQEWRAVGAKIVFTNGCFDLLHPGHISLLYQARALGDRLIVGLNTDASVRRLKGSERPILSEQDRAAMLSALACVDLVVQFDEDTPLKLIQTLMPDILVKGSDYKTHEVVGREVVEAYGGCVKLVELVQGYSTTKLTQKVMTRSSIPES